MTPPPDTSDQSEPDPRIARCRRVVDALVEVGMNLIRSLDPARGPVMARDPYLAYCRVSRALRLTLLLDQRLDALASGAEAFAAEVALDRAVLGETDSEAQETLVERPDTETLRPAPDREAPDEVLRYLRRPLIELVAAICRDFGLSPEETAEAQAPFLALAANDDPPPDPEARPWVAPTPPPTAEAPAPAARALGP